MESIEDFMVINQHIELDLETNRLPVQLCYNSCISSHIPPILSSGGLLCFTAIVTARYFSI